MVKTATSQKVMKLSSQWDRLADQIGECKTILQHQGSAAELMEWSAKAQRLQSSLQELITETTRSLIGEKDPHER